MKKSSKFLSIIMALIMVVSIIPMSNITASAYTDSGACGDNLTWTFDDSTGTLTISGTGAMYDYQKDYYFVGGDEDGYFYDYVNYPWEYYADNIETVTISDGVTTIGNYAFGYCYSLTSITIPDSVTTIGEGAFWYCDSLTSVTISDSVTTIGDDAFYLCYSLTSITVDSNNKYYSNDKYGVLFNKNKTVLIQYPIGNTRKSYTIPDSVTTIGNYAFRYCYSLTSITISDSVTTIGGDAFCYCHSLTSVTIGNSVTTIGGWAFCFCDSLTDVYYGGTEEQWKKISIDSYNEDLTNATIHYNSTGGNFVFEYSDYTQTHVVEDYLSEYDAYEIAYFGGMASAMDGTDGNADLCVPGLSKTDDMIPQGIAYYPAKNWILISAYNKDGDKPSVIYALDKSTGNYVAQFDIYNKDGTIHKGHVGGIAVSNNNLYLANDKYISYIPLSEFNVEKGTVKHVNINDSKSMSSQLGEASVAYVSITDGVLFAGNFYTDRDEKYSTPANTSAESIVVGYELAGSTSSKEWENLNTSNQNYKYFISDKDGFDEIQCATLKDGKLYLSCSYGRKNESLLKVINVGTKKTDVIYLSSDTYVGLPMMESIVFIDDALYTIFASSSHYYNGYDSSNKAVNPTDVIWKIDYKALINNDVYSFNEETYKFYNFEDEHSKGHCFGMSVTSSGYHNGYLDINKVGGNETTDVYGLTDTEVVKEPICHYQKIQGSYRNRSIVAGGTQIDILIPNTERDWKQITNYVKEHQYDNKGNLVIGMKYGLFSGHAINFLRYAVVDGQERIYAYDNNNPLYEVYFYMNSDGKIMQGPGNKDDGIICLYLMDVEKYYSIAKEYKPTRVIYGNTAEIKVDGATVSDMACGETGYAMFELPNDVDNVVITPLIDNATFEYCDKEYSFGEISDNTIGVLTLATSEENVSEEANLVIEKLEIEILQPSMTTIRHKDGIKLHTRIEGIVPDGYYVKWVASNDKFKTEEINGGDSLKIVSDKNGNTTFTAILCDADGNELARDTIEMKSKAGFFEKIGSFFRSIFGGTKIHDR